MLALRYPVQLAILSFGISILAACDASNGGPLQLPGFSFDLGHGRSNDQPESQTADPPQQVVGAYLTCAFMDSREAVAAKGRNGDVIPVGCGLYKRSIDKPEKKPELASLTGLQSKTGMSCSGRKTVRFVTAKSTTTKNLQNHFDILTSELPCQIQMRVWDQNGRRALFAKSVPTITQANAAEEGFDIEADMREQNFAFADEATDKAPNGISTRAANSELGNMLAREIGGSVGEEISRSTNQNFNGGRLIGLKTQYEFVPGLNSKQVSSGGIVLSSSGYGASGGATGSGPSNSSSRSVSESNTSRDELTPEEKRKLQQRQAKHLQDQRAKADAQKCASTSSVALSGTPTGDPSQGAAPANSGDQDCTSRPDSTNSGQPNNQPQPTPGTAGAKVPTAGP
ncbi:MAG: hypothetical protein RL011_634 [Pseudomonadota bacterium]|jgi:hypothetical protein